MNKSSQSTITTAGVISLNPAQKTPAAMNPDMGFRVAQRRIVHSSEAEKLKNVINFCFGSLKFNEAAREKIYYVRIVAAFILVGCGILMGATSGNMLLLLGGVLSGLVLGVGLMTRITMLTASIFYLSAAACNLYINGMSEMLSMCAELGAMLICVIFMLSGSVWRSADNKLRLSVYKKANAERMRRERARHEFSYLAFRNSL